MTIHCSCECCFEAPESTINSPFRHELPELDGDAYNRAVDQDSETIASALENCLPSIVTPDEPVNPFDSGDSETSSLNFEALVSLRRMHQRKQAETGVQKNPGHSSEAATARQKLLQQFQKLVKEQQEHGVSTTARHSIRWQPGWKPAEILQGNALNASETATRRAAQASASNLHYMDVSHLDCTGLNPTKQCVQDKQAAEGIGDGTSDPADTTVSNNDQGSPWQHQLGIYFSQWVNHAWRR